MSSRSPPEGRTSPRSPSIRPNGIEIASSSTEPVWVQVSLIEKHVAEASATQRRVSPSSANRANARKSHRDGELGGGWGWLFGYSSIANSLQSSNAQPFTPLPDKTLTLRKAPPLASPTIHSKQTPRFSQGHAHGHDSQRTIRIQDEFNHKYNNTSFTISPQEYRAHVLPANVTNAKENTDGESPLHFTPPKNLIDLTHLHEPALVHSLNIRYSLDQVYTLCGAILIALNPFANIHGLYGDDVIHTYRQRSSLNTFDESSSNTNKQGGLEPHIYAIASSAFLAMQASIANVLEQNRQGLKRKTTAAAAHTLQLTSISTDQSILISGESGAGKTYNTKMAMRYLASTSQHMASSTSTSTSTVGNKSMEQQVLQSNPILESFGNARTLRNDNSSRFGKLIDIKFHYSGYILGASIDTYLLEKVRLVRQAEGERNYHIFYELLMGLTDSKKRQQLGLHGYEVQDFKITCMSGTFNRRDGVCDVDTYKELLQAFDTVGFSSEDQIQLFQVITGLLHMSNMTFHECAGTSDSSTLNTKNPSLAHVLNLFGVQVQSLTEALCTCTLIVRGETMIKNLTVDKAEKAKEGLMKATYGALFEYIVQRVNQSTTNAGNNHAREDQTRGSHEYAHIKILDIFGFESFQVNSFEQLCINYTNEALQQQFNIFVFKMEQEEYEREGIDWSFIDFPDNQDILDLIERKHVGILSLLDEQCRLVKCSGTFPVFRTYFFSTLFRLH